MEVGVTAYEIMSLVFSTAGFITVIVTIRQLIDQTSHLRRTVLTNATEIISSFTLEVNKVFVDHPELRPYFHSGQDISDDHPEHNRALAVAELLLDYCDTIIEQKGRLPEIWPTEEATYAHRYTVDMFKQSPILCRFVETHSSWYSDTLMALMSEGRNAVIQTQHTGVPGNVAQPQPIKGFRQSLQ